MQFQTYRVDVAPSLTSGVQPALALPLPAHAELLVAIGPIFFGDESVRWGLVRVGAEYVIPMYGYKTLEASPAAIWGLGVQLGITALAAAQAKFDRINPIEAVLVLGDQYTDLRPAESAFRCYLGVAFRVK